MRRRPRPSATASLCRPAIIIAALNQTSQSATITGVSAGPTRSASTSRTPAPTPCDGPLGNSASLNGPRLGDRDRRRHQQRRSGRGHWLPSPATRPMRRPVHIATPARWQQRRDAPDPAERRHGRRAAHETPGLINSINASLVGGSGALLFHSTTARLGDDRRQFYRSRTSLTARNLTATCSRTRQSRRRLVGLIPGRAVC